MFWRRAFSVVVLVPLILLIIYWDGWSYRLYLLLISATVLMMQVEYCRLAGNFGDKIESGDACRSNGSIQFLCVFLTRSDRKSGNLHCHVLFLGCGFYLRFRFKHIPRKS